MTEFCAVYLHRSAIEHHGRKHAAAQFPKASVIANNRIVFDIAGNSFRLIVAFNYGFLAGYIKFFGTHAQYDRVDAATVDHTGVQHGQKNR